MRRSINIKERWAQFRFSIIGGLLSSPPKRGELKQELINLSKKQWKHPIKDKELKISVSTLERWYYQSRSNEVSPIEVLRNKSRKDVGNSKTLSKEVQELIISQYKAHRSWNYQLHADNIIRKLKEKEESKIPSYDTIRRFMQTNGLLKQKRVRNAIVPMDTKEVRSFEVEYVNGLWHLDFHHCKLQILNKKGQWLTPICLSVMDDYSRLACHIQWYLSESTQELVHGFCQALQKRGVPRALLTDNGAAMTSAEFTQGLERLSVQGFTTLPYSPYQNGKQERFFGQLESRLVAMLENKKELNLKLLNDATIAWVEMEYNKTIHRELKASPIERFLKGKNVGRKCPDGNTFVLNFTREVIRRMRRNDGTISLEGQRFEIPSRYINLREVILRYAHWDLSKCYLIDKNRGTILCSIYPINKKVNAQSQRRSISSAITETPATEEEIPPLLQNLLEEYSATGLPPAYISKDEEK